MCWASFLVSTGHCPSAFWKHPCSPCFCLVLWLSDHPPYLPFLAHGPWSAPQGWHTRQALGLALGSQPLLGLARALLPFGTCLRGAPWVSRWGHLTGLGSRLLLQTNPFAHRDGMLPHGLARLQTPGGPLGLSVACSTLSAIELPWPCGFNPNYIRLHISQFLKAKSYMNLTVKNAWPSQCHSPEPDTHV